MDLLRDVNADHDTIGHAKADAPVPAGSVTRHTRHRPGRRKPTAGTTRTLPFMVTSETSRFVRLRVDLVVEIEDSVALTGAALQRIEDDAAESGANGAGGASGEDGASSAGGDGARGADDGAGSVAGHGMSAEERIHAITAVQQDEAEALAYLIDPFHLVSDIPGVDLAQASWSSEEIDYDPDSPEWPLGVDDGGEEGDEGEYGEYGG